MINKIKQKDWGKHGIPDIIKKSKDDDDDNKPSSSGGGSSESYEYERTGLPLGGNVDEVGNIYDNSGNIVGYYDYEKNKSYINSSIPFMVPFVGPSGGFNFNFNLNLTPIPILP